MEKTSSNIRSLSYVLYFSYPTAPLFYKYVTLFSTLRVMQIKEKHFRENEINIHQGRD